MNTEIDLLRDNITDCDYKLLRLLGKRFRLTDKIGELKKAHGVTVECSDIEAAKLKLLSEHCDFLTEGEVGVIFAGVIRVSRARQYFQRLTDVSPSEL